MAQLVRMLCGVLMERRLVGYEMISLGIESKVSNRYNNMQLCNLNVASLQRHLVAF